MVTIRAKGHDATNAVSPEERFQRVKVKKEKLKKIKALKQEKLAANLRIAQSSTASMGKFDKKVSKDEVKKKVGKKKQNVSMFFDARKEIDRNKGKFVADNRTAQTDGQVRASLLSQLN